LTRARVIALLLLAASTPLSAELRPTPGTGDPRIQTVVYDPDQIITLQVAPGYQLTLEFDAGERIENVAVGDSGAWQVTPNKRGDHLFIKAAQSGVTTNMTVVTDSRTYSFLLAPAYGPMPDLPFTVRIKSAAPAIATIDANGPTKVEEGLYKLSGSRALRPAAMSDDGVHTYIEWAPAQTMPAVFALDPLGQETLVNGMMRDGMYVIDSVAKRLVFRLNAQTAYASRHLPRKRR
jgi:type IV secretion system protein VirB9